MGVRGITRFLGEQGLLPTDDDDDNNNNKSTDGTQLFGTWSASQAFLQSNSGPPKQPLPEDSTLLVDGNGLVFYIHEVAYRRHLQSLGSRLSDLTAEQRSLALPCMIPLSLLTQVAREYIQVLSRFQQLSVKIYWDGHSTAQPFKSETLKSRSSQREVEWGQLQQYCTHGILQKSECKSWGFEFPMARLALRAVRQALVQQAASNSAQIQMVQCQGEADLELARQASGKPSVYVVGRDSDFLFYKGIHYIPFDSLDVAPNALYASVLSRSQLADRLSLHDEDMVELAILLGNDYIDRESLSSGLKIRHVADAVEHLQEQEQGYQVQVTESSVAADFCRALYNLQDLSIFDDHADDASVNSVDSEGSELLPLVQFADDFAWETTKILPTDALPAEAIVRSLELYRDHVVEDDSFGVETSNTVAILAEHIEAYQAAQRLRQDPSTTPNTLLRPTWMDMKASYLIEKCVVECLRRSQTTILGKLASPEMLFDRVAFFRALSATRPVVSTTDAETTTPFGVSTSADQDETDEAGDTIVEQDEMTQTVERKRLPIDDHEETIVESVLRNRVTVIHGETGCGKSSRVPIMLLEAPPPDPSANSRVKLFMSQPRRIAAKALVERVRSCEPKHRDKFALRMGHGWREYESNKTQAWFVTTGYLTRLLANHPERFDSVTHLIIDEVHERSVDTDILCLLCRRLLKTNTTIRLVLMSATLAAKMYQDYFDIPNEPIHVGVRTFPITEYFVEDLKAFQLPPKELLSASAIRKECTTKRCKSPPTANEMSKRFSLAARLAIAVGEPGSSVLIFVPGMNEILSIIEQIEAVYVPDVSYQCFPIHSDIPFEEQMDAFKTPGEHEVKIIIATNAAESSVTLPAVDHVICLGLCKLITYNERSHRQMLTSAWISKASAKQRAGRTGRVRPGTVYRLYTRDAYENEMEDFEPGEIVRMPLDSVILMLKQMLHEEITPVLCDCIEPPEMKTIERSFQSLHRWNFITEACDEAEITTLGAFVSALGVDLTLGSLVGLGIQFGVAAEAIEMAAILSFPKTPFQISSPMYHDAKQYNETTAQAYMAKCHFDANLYSEPLALMNALWDYCMAKDKSKWCGRYRFAIARMKQLASTRDSLRKRVASFLGIHETKLQLSCPPAEMPHSKINMLRVIKVWVFSETLVECPPLKLKGMADGGVQLSLQGASLEDEFLDGVLDKDRHPYKIVSTVDKVQSGTFKLDGKFSLPDFVTTMDSRLISYMIQMEISLSICRDEDSCFVFVNRSSSVYDTLNSFFEQNVEEWGKTFVQAVPTSKNRGISERKAGAWELTRTRGASKNDSCKDFCIFNIVNDRTLGIEMLVHFVDESFKLDGTIESMLFWAFTGARGKKKKKSKQAGSQFFSVLVRGDINKIANRDLMDLLATGDIEEGFVPKKKKEEQAIRFLKKHNEPVPYKGKDQMLLALCNPTDFCSRYRPLFEDIPEGARIFSVLASGRRTGGSRLCFPPPADSKAQSSNNKEDEETVDVRLSKDETNITFRWKRLDSKNDSVFVNHDTVAASAASLLHGLVACPSNALELRNGGLRVENLTILPPNPLFLVLAFLTFGLEPSMASTATHIAGNEPEDSGEDVARAERSWGWLRKRWAMGRSNEDKNSIRVEFEDIFPARLDKEDAMERIFQAIEFNKQSSMQGETLMCYPEMVEKLCELFSSVDGYDFLVWDELRHSSLTPANLSAWQKEFRTTAVTDEDVDRGRASSKSKSRKEKTEQVKTQEEAESVGKDRIANQIQNTAQANENVVAIFLNKKKKKKKKHGISMATERNGTGTDKPSKAQQPEAKLQEKPRVETQEEPFVNCTQSSLVSLDLNMLSQKLVVVPEGGNPTLSMQYSAFYTLCAILKKYKEATGGLANESPINLLDWSVRRHVSKDGKNYFCAIYSTEELPRISVKLRGKTRLPLWIKVQGDRPKTIREYLPCLPAQTGTPCPPAVTLRFRTKKRLAFETLEDAVNVEAAFYLESQFGRSLSKKKFRHWYDSSIEELVETLLRRQTMTKGEILSQQ